MIPPEEFEALPASIQYVSLSLRYLHWLAFPYRQIQDLLHVKYHSCCEMHEAFGSMHIRIEHDR